MTDKQNFHIQACNCAECVCDGTCGDMVNGHAEVDDSVPSICGSLTLAKDQCIVALSEDGTGYILARSDDIIERDILLEDTAEDNNFDSNWDQDLLVGVYLLCVHPWSEPNYEGEYDCGIHVTGCAPLWAVEAVKQ